MKSLSTIIALFFYCAALSGQNGDPNFVTSDIDNFWSAYDKIIATRDSAEQYEYLNSLYIQKGSPGLHAIMRARRYTPESYIHAINSYPLFWASIRNNTYQSKKFARDIEAGIRKLKNLYPDTRPAKVYFTIGAFRTGGTTIDSLVLIGCEIAMADENTVTREFPKNMDYLEAHFKSNPIKNTVFLNVHEYVHTQQKDHEYILLYRSVYEGIAEFMAVRATGEASTLPAIGYGMRNDKKIRKKFEQEMFSPHAIDRWLYNNTENEFKTRDLGYYVGYAICEKYYARSADKQRAVKEMIELDYSNEDELARFIDRSAYFPKSLKKLKKAYDKSRPGVAKIVQFKNGDAAVKPGPVQITVRFSDKMDTRYRGFDYGPLGEAHTLRVKSVSGFSEDGRSITFETDLEPGRRYQVLLTDRFRTVGGIPLTPYLIDFETSGK